MNRIGRALVVALVVAACADDDGTADTLDPLDDQSTATEAAPDATSRGTATGSIAAPSSAPFQAAGEGTVTIQVRLAASALDETLSLDRAKIPADELDPISLFATCTALDGPPAAPGADYVVRVIDLRRLTSDNELVAAALSVDSPVEAPGPYDVTLELSDVSQASMTYSGTLTVDRGLNAGTFEVVDERGDAATGSFSCTRPKPRPTTTVPPTSAAGTTTTTRPATTAPVTTGATTSVAINTTTVASTSPPPST